METTFKPELYADEATVTNMHEYGCYTILEAMPNYIDGLRLVHRRILVAMGDTSDRIKGSAIVGNCMQYYHPHGDGGIYDAVVRLAQPFNQCLPLISSDGNVGAYGGGQPAAMRYLDLTNAEFARDVYFNHTNPKTLVYVPTEVGKGVEPAFLVPAIPMALLTGTQGIAIGYKSQLPYLNFISVCDLVLKYLENKHKDKNTYKTKYKEYAKYLIPDYPIAGLLLNEQELLHQYGEGVFNTSAVMTGVMELSPNKINIRTIPYGQDFSKCVEQCLGDLTKQASFVTANFTEVLDLTTGQMMGDVELPLKRGTDPFPILNTLKKTINFVKPRGPIWNFCNHEGELLPMDPITLVEAWYQVRYNCVISDLKQTNVDLFNEYRKLRALEVVADNTNKVLNIFKNAENKEATIEPLCKTFRLSQYQAQFLSKLQMHQITHQGKEDLVRQVREVMDKIKQLQEKFGMVDNIIVEQVEKLKAKYKGKCARKTEFNRFTCALMVTGSGIIQSKDMEELSHHVTHWESRDIEIMLYPTTKHRKVPYLGNTAFPGIPSHFVAKEYDLQKEIHCDLLRVTPYYTKHTIVLNDNEKTIYRLNGDQFIRNAGYRAFAVHDDFTVIDKKGKISTMRYTAVPKRNNPVASGVLTDVVYISDKVDQGEGLVLITANTNEPNTLTLELVHDGGKYNKLFMGTTVYFGMFKLDEQFACTMPQELLARCSIKHLYIRDLSQVMTSKRVQIMLNRKQTSTGCNLVPYTKNSNIWTVKEK